MGIWLNDTVKYINSQVIFMIVDFKVDIIFSHQGTICYFAPFLSGI